MDTAEQKIVMKNKTTFIISVFCLAISLTYWILSCIALNQLMFNSGEKFPDWLTDSLFICYSLGFILGFIGGDFWVFFGQLISLIFILAFNAMIIVGLRRRDKRKQLKNQ